MGLHKNLTGDDLHDPKAHADLHENGGAQEISVAGLSGVLADAQNADHIQGRDVQDAAPSDGNALVWNSSESRWEPGNAASSGDVNDENVKIDTLGTPTYDNLEDLLSIFQSASLISGANVTDGGSGTIDISAGKAFIKTTDAEIAKQVFLDIAAATGLSLTDGVENWVYLDYNSGTPQYAVTTNFQSIDHHTKIVVSRVWRDGTNLSIFNVGSRFSDHDLHSCLKDFMVFGAIRAFGLVVSEVGTRNLAVSMGRIYCASNPSDVAALDTSDTDTFSYWYRNGSGGWTEVASQTQINNTQYDDGDGTLGSLGNNRYGIHWVYIDFGGNLHVQYGQGSYLLSSANSAEVPTPPTKLSSFAVLAAKIIIARNGTSFYTIQSAYSQAFQAADVENHNDLSNIQGGEGSEYYHLSAEQHESLPTLNSIVIQEHFVQYSVGYYNHRYSSWAGGGSLGQAAAAGHQGVVRINHGSGAEDTGRSLYTGGNAFIIGGDNDIVFEMLCQLRWWNAGETKFMVFGIGDNFNGASEPSNGVYFRFGTSDTYLSIVAASGGTRTVEASDLTPSVDTWYKLKFVISNPTTSPSIQMYIDGVAKGDPITTNIPTGAIDSIGFKMVAADQAQSVAVDVDYFFLSQEPD